MRVFITGGSGGIGFAVASAYAADGHEVILADINLALAQEKAAELVAAGGIYAQLWAHQTGGFIGLE